MKYLSGNIPKIQIYKLIAEVHNTLCLWSVVLLHSFTFICNAQLFWSNLQSWLEAICRVLLSSFIKCFHSQIYSYNFSNLFHKGLPIFFQDYCKEKVEDFWLWAFTYFFYQAQSRSTKKNHSNFITRLPIYCFYLLTPLV